MSEWAQRKFHEHKERTLKWKKTKSGEPLSPYEVIVAPGAEKWYSTAYPPSFGVVFSLPRLVAILLLL